MCSIYFNREFIYASILGINSLIKEESEGTIEFLYAQPISRVKIVMIKMFSTFTILYIFNVIIFLVTILLFQILKKEHYEYIMQLTFMYKGMFLAQLVFWAIGLALSSIISKVSIATPTALSIFFTSYLLGIFSTIIEKLSWMKYLSPIQYVMPNKLLKSQGAIAPSYIIICLLVIIISIIFTLYRYKNKDFKL